MNGRALTYLKLKPTKDSELTFDDTKEILSHLQQVSAKNFKLVIKSTGQSPNEFFLGTAEDQLDTLSSLIYAVCPTLVLEKLTETKVEIAKPSSSFSFKFRHHFAYPLHNLAKADSQALFKLLAAINRLKGDEQLTISLTSSLCLSPRARFIRRRLLNGYSPYLNDKTLKGYLIKALSLAVYALSGILKLVIVLLNNLSTRPKQAAKIRQYKVDNEESVLLLDKLYQPLFKTRLTVDVKATPKRLAEIKKEVELAFKNFAHSTGYQEFVISSSKTADIYSISDLAAMLHFSALDLKSGLYDFQQFKSLPLTKLLSGKKQIGDSVLGLNNFQGSRKAIVLPKSARYRHTYISGATGSGKSTLLANLISQDIQNGLGATLIDPHGDLADTVMKNIPPNRLKDVIYFDPSKVSNSYSINLLAMKSKPGTEAYLKETDQLCETVISLFRKVFMIEDISSHRLEYILRNSILTALELPGSNIFTIFRLLTDSSFRLSAIPKLKDQNLINFWRNEIGRAGEYQRIKMTAGITSKIGRFLFSVTTKRVFGQTRSNLDIKDVIDNKKILICNFSKGNLGEDNSKLFSTAILTQLQLAALSRANVDASKRVDHFVYIDEFQNLAPSVLIQMLSELRKYGLYLSMAEQSPSQQDNLSTNIILANSGNLICFRTASPKDIQLLLPRFADYLKASDLINLPAYNFYLSSVAEKVIAPTSGQTILMTKNNQFKVMADKRTSNKITKTRLVSAGAI